MSKYNTPLTSTHITTPMGHEFLEIRDAAGSSLCWFEWWPERNGQPAGAAMAPSFPGILAELVNAYNDLNSVEESP